MAPGRQLRILSITYDYFPFDVRVRRLAESAIDAGYAVDVICLRQDDEVALEVYRGGAIHRLPLARGFGKSLPVMMLHWNVFTALAGAKAARLHLRQPYDIILVHNMPDFLVFSALVPKMLGARVALDVQDVSPELMAAKAQGRKREILRRAASLQERISTGFADMVITVGEPFQRKLLKRGVASSKLRIVLNSADPHIFPEARRFTLDDALRPVKPPHDATTPFIVMYWGTLAQRNGLATALRALALALPQAPMLRLDIMGRGEDIPELKRLADELRIGDRVRFTDPVPAERIVDFVTHGDVGIIPYSVDGFTDLVLPTKAYELAWLQRPIIASNTTGIRSMFRPESVMFCEPENPQSFAQALVELYQQPEKRRVMVASATADYEPYRWETESQRYAALLADLARVRVPRLTVPASSRA